MNMMSSVDMTVNSLVERFKGCSFVTSGFTEAFSDVRTQSNLTAISAVQECVFPSGHYMSDVLLGEPDHQTVSTQYQLHRKGSELCRI